MDRQALWSDPVAWRALSGTALRKGLSEGTAIPDHFGRDEVLTTLKEYYAGLDEKVEVKLYGAATGDDRVAGYSHSGRTMLRTTTVP